MAAETPVYCTLISLRATAFTTNKGRSPCTATIASAQKLRFYIAIKLPRQYKSFREVGGVGGVGGAWGAHIALTPKCYQAGAYEEGEKVVGLRRSYEPAAA